MEEVEKVISLIWLGGAHVIVENIVLNMVHHYVVKSVETWWDADERAHENI